MFIFLLIVFIILCLCLCLLILIQSDKGGGISGAIGGLSGANSFLGTQDTANILTKGTYIFGAGFLLLCVLMTFFTSGAGGSGAKSEMQKRAERVQGVTATPATPGLGFMEEAAPAAEEATGGRPVIVGDIIEGGVVKRVGEDGKLVEVEQPASAP